MRKIGKFYGIGVGPGAQGFIPVAAAEALKICDIIMTPRSKDSADSVAKQCIAFLNLDDSCFVEVGFQMSNDRSLLAKHYKELGEEIKTYLLEGKNVGYITLGDPFTFSTYSYTLEALKEITPDLDYITFPGISSFHAIASACSWPLGEGKERVLILPCPDDMEELRQEIETHDVVILMKIGKRYPMVRDLILDMGIMEYCCLGHKAGTEEEAIYNAELPEDAALGYFTTMLIRSQKTIIRHRLTS